MTVKEPALSAALSEVIDVMTRFFGSTTEIDKLHAKALEDLTGLVRNLHDRALALEARVMALEGYHDISRNSRDSVLAKVIPASQNDPVASLKTPNWEKKL